jgi:hypothetical protein
MSQLHWIAALSALLMAPLAMVCLTCWTSLQRVHRLG